MPRKTICAACDLAGHLKQEILTYCGNFEPLTENADISDLSWRWLKVGKLLVWIASKLDGPDLNHPILTLGNKIQDDALGMLHLHRSRADVPKLCRVEMEGEKP